MAITHPKCDRSDCFANKCGVMCDALYECEDPKKCSFFKTVDQVDNERIKAHNRLKEIGREDLIKKYEYNRYRKW